MLKEIKNHEQLIQERISKKAIDQSLYQYHIDRVHDFQHERLIHLLVMLFVGLFVLITSIAVYSINNTTLYFIDGLLLLLFFPYVLYYHHIENAVQKLYKITYTLFTER